MRKLLLLLILLGFGPNCLIHAQGTPFTLSGPNGVPVPTNSTDGLRSEPATTINLRCRVAGSFDYGPCDVSSLAGAGRGLELLAVGDNSLGTNQLSTSKQSVASQLAAARGWSLTNRVDDTGPLDRGYHALGANWDWSRNLGLGTVVLLSGANQLSTDLCQTEGGGACATLTSVHLNLISAEEMAWLTWAGSLEARKTLAADCVPAVGAWSPQSSRWLPSFARYASTAGASLTCKCPQASTCFVITTVSNGTAGVFGISVDGTSVSCGFPSGSTSCSNKTDDAVGDPSGTVPVGIVATRIGGLSLGDHSVSITVSAGSAGSIGVLGVVASTPTDARPVVLSNYATRIAHTSPSYSFRTDALVSVVNAGQDQDTSTLQRDGFQVVPVRLTCGTPVTESTSCWEPNSATQTSADGTTPNQTGGQYATNAILAALKAAGR
ncbi:hypothetical protein [Terriglobus sp. TAA 43]|uniref:hypothetical protein n=1 Tax=Terriglobus sp. TAA 43 TaxID=278961 RepID=UPI0012EEC8BC|nr:hypothetical protein [Terriglobus sp. TAA 43]